MSYYKKRKQNQKDSAFSLKQLLTRTIYASYIQTGF
ncbi:hypothetical protein L950_0224500 [Sphingobacterium sp. IITKGP-BTPF85]|nr:hypothetical protein L950_0224500 [Sphingobacterium sp. IITKGP-BTPF85]